MTTNDNQAHRGSGAGVAADSGSQTEQPTRAAHDPSGLADNSNCHESEEARETADRDLSFLETIQAELNHSAERHRVRGRMYQCLGFATLTLLLAWFAGYTWYEVSCHPTGLQFDKLVDFLRFSAIPLLCATPIVWAIRILRRNENEANLAHKVDLHRAFLAVITNHAVSTAGAADPQNLRFVLNDLCDYLDRALSAAVSGSQARNLDALTHYEHAMDVLRPRRRA